MTKKIKYTDNKEVTSDLELFKLSEVEVPEMGIVEFPENTLNKELKEIKGKLEGVEKAADDSEVVKGMNVYDNIYEESYWLMPDIDNVIPIQSKNGINLEVDEVINSSNDGLIISADTDYLATREYVKSATSALEGIKKVADDNEVVKRILISTPMADVTSSPAYGCAEFIFTPSSGINVEGNYESGEIIFSADTEYLATKEDLKNKANNNEVCKTIEIYSNNVEQGLLDSKLYDGGFIFNTTKGITLDIFEKIEDKGATLLIGADTDYLATREYVDGIKTSILGSDSLNESFDTLQEVAEWIEGHSGEASEIIAKLNELSEWKTNISSNIILKSLTPSYDTNNITLTGARMYLGGSSYQNLVVTLDTATSTKAGVMSASDKQALDKLVANSTPTLVKVPVDDGVGFIIAENNKYYRVDDVVINLGIKLPPVEEDEIVNFIVYFTTGNTIWCDIGNGDNIPINYFKDFAIEAHTTYELNIMFNGNKWVVGYAVVELEKSDGESAGL